MNKDKQQQPTNANSNKAQEGRDVKAGLPIKNTVTDEIKNSASQTPGLNQEKTDRDDLLPSDGDNLTN